MTGNLQALLLLSDGRLPTGGYAHSGGLEAAIRLGEVASIPDLKRFLMGRATTSGMVAAAFAAAACHVCGNERYQELSELNTEFQARTPSPALQEVSLSLGRQLMRAWSAIYPHSGHQQVPRVLHQPVAFGAAAAFLELDPIDAARGILHETLMTPAMAVVKLMSVDPFDAHQGIAELLPQLDEIVEHAATFADRSPGELPANAAPLSDIIAEHHAQVEVRLFAS